MCHSRRAGPYGTRGCSSCGFRASCHSTCSPGYACHTSCKSGHGCRSACSHGGRCGRCRSSCVHGTTCANYDNDSSKFYNNGAVPVSHTCSAPGCTPKQRCGNCMQDGRNYGFIFLPLAILTGGLSCAAFGIARTVQRRRAEKALAKAQLENGFNAPGEVDGEKSGLVERESTEVVVDERAEPPAYADVAGDAHRQLVERLEKKGF